MRRKTFPIAIGAFLLGLATTSAWRAHAAGGTWAGACEATPQEFIDLTITSVKVDGQPSSIEAVPAPIPGLTPPPDAALDPDAALESDAALDPDAAGVDGAP